MKKKKSNHLASSLSRNEEKEEQSLSKLPLSQSRKRRTIA
jgi:hypothetical protein